MAMDERYQWPVRDGVRGPDGNPKTLGIGIGVDNGRVTMNTHGWASLDEDAVDYLQACVEAAKVAARRQRGRS